MSRRDNWQPEDGMGFAGLVPTLAEKRQEAYEQRQLDTIRDLREQLRARDEEIAGLRKAVTLARNTFEGYAALHREKGTPDGDAKAALNQDLSARMNAALQEKSRAAG